MVSSSSRPLYGTPEKSVELSQGEMNEAWSAYSAVVIKGGGSTRVHLSSMLDNDQLSLKIRTMPIFISILDTLYPIVANARP